MCERANYANEGGSVRRIMTRFSHIFRGDSFFPLCVLNKIWCVYLLSIGWKVMYANETACLRFVLAIVR